MSVQNGEINQKTSPEEVKHALYAKYHQLPVQMNKIVCSNFHGKGYGCNPKYIAEALLRKNKNLDIVWLVNDKYDFPEGVRTVPFHSEEAIAELATARVLIDNQMKFIGFVKRPDQYYINTWHGAIPLKKIGFDNPSNKDKKAYKKRVGLNFDAIDVITSNSSFCTEMFRRSFKYEGYVLEKGYPRNDILLQDCGSVRSKVLDKLRVPADKKTLLYAPTFRDDRSLDAYQLDYSRLAEALGEDWVVLIRLHPHLQKKAGKLEYSRSVVNASVYPDMQELMAASDILVTDYSNIMFEFCLTGRPCCLYATDIEAYRKKRDYYFEIHHLPFPVATTTDELITLIREFDYKGYQTKVERFKDQVGMIETGCAAECAADLIFKMTRKFSFLPWELVWNHWKEDAKWMAKFVKRACRHKNQKSDKNS